MEIWGALFRFMGRQLLDLLWKLGSYRLLLSIGPFDRLGSVTCLHVLCERDRNVMICVTGCHKNYLGMIVIGSSMTNRILPQVVSRPPHHGHVA